MDDVAILKLLLALLGLLPLVWGLYKYHLSPIPGEMPQPRGQYKYEEYLIIFIFGYDLCFYWSINKISKLLQGRGFNWMVGSRIGEASHPGPGNDDRKRAHKEAETTKYKSNPGASHKNQKEGPPINAPATVENANTAIVKEKRRLLVISTFHCYAADGVSVYKKVGNHYVGPSGKIFPDVILEGEVVLGTCKDGVLSYEVENGEIVSPTRTMCICGFEFHKLDREIFQGVSVEPRTYVVFVLGLKLIREKLPSTGKVDEIRRRTAAGLLSREFDTHGLFPRLLVQTAMFWFETECRVNFSLMNTTMLRFGGTSLVNDFDEVAAPVIRTVGLNNVYVFPYRLDAIEYENFELYDFKPIYTVKCRNSVCDPEAMVYPTFNTMQRPPGRRSKKYTSRFFRIGGAVSFIQYDISPINTCAAMARLLAARDDEQEFYSNQITFLYFLQNMKKYDVSPRVPHGFIRSFWGPFVHIRWPYIRNSVLNVLRTNLDYPFKGDVMVGAGEDYHVVEVLPVEGLKLRVYTRVAWALSCLFTRCTRTYLNHLIDIWKGGVNWAYYTMFYHMSEWIDIWWGRDQAANIEHASKERRRQFVNGVPLHDDSDCLVKVGKAYIKWEDAKPGKYPRLYISYGPGCMYANELPEFQKLCLMEPFWFPRDSLSKDCEVKVWILSKPYPGFLDEALCALIAATETPNFVLFVVYSDDMCCAGKRGNVQFGFNLDIKKCDATTNSCSFAIEGQCLSNFSEPRALGKLRQCMAPIVVDSPDHPSESFSVNFHGPVEGSGIDITTSINHKTSFRCVCCIASLFDENLSVLECIEQGSRLMGIELSIESIGQHGNLVYEKFQLLKRSPLRTKCGHWVAALNYACIVRNLGAVDGDLCARQVNLENAAFKVLPWIDRINLFSSGVVRGHKHEPRSVIMDALRQRFSTGELVIEPVYSELLSKPFYPEEVGMRSSVLAENMEIELSSLNRRYDLYGNELSDLATAILNLEVGDDLVSEAVTAFNRVDYGLG